MSEQGKETQSKDTQQALSKLEERVRRLEELENYDELVSQLNSLEQDLFVKETDLHACEEALLEAKAETSDLRRKLRKYFMFTKFVKQHLPEVFDEIERKFEGLVDFEDIQE